MRKSDLFPHRRDFPWLKMQYQPIVGFMDGRLYSREALSRWGSYSEILLPKQFLSLIRQLGQMERMTLSVLLIACEHMRDFHCREPVHINIPPDCFTPRLRDSVKWALDYFNVHSSLLVLEFLEEEFSWIPEILSVARDFHRMGVELVFDDFDGQEWQRRLLDGFPFDAVKTAGHVLDPRSHDGLSGVLCMLQGQGVTKIVVEGIETKAHQERVREAGSVLGNGVHHLLAQGFLYGMPVNGEDAFS